MSQAGLTHSYNNHLWNIAAVNVYVGEDINLLNRNTQCHENWPRLTYPKNSSKNWIMVELTLKYLQVNVNLINICQYEALLYLPWNMPRYKSNTLDWYVIPRDKMKNITYGYANERAGRITHAQFMWIKSLRHINYAVAHAQSLRQHM